ncbi:hypothetical protein BGP75_25890 [Motiliproteus sp. MSK22-1]|nr:hypothetical protein BGP75_25890 [Motiliproteus sp. MSK22-1]
MALIAGTRNGLLNKFTGLFAIQSVDSQTGFVNIRSCTVRLPDSAAISPFGCGSSWQVLLSGLVSFAFAPVLRCRGFFCYWGSAMLRNNSGVRSTELARIYRINFRDFYRDH